jgi:thioredoxin reductase (NADPH)
MFDVIIIGGGAAGLTAGLYAQRAGLRALLIEKLMTGGQAATTAHIDNYPGFDEGIGGMELGMKMEAHALRFGLEIIYDEVVGLALTGDVKTVTVSDTAYEAKTVILAMGAKNRLLNVEGEEKFTGRGVSYCATCDGAFFAGKDVAVIGGGNTAVEDAIELSRIANKVYLIHRRNELRADKILADQLDNAENIVKVFDSVAENIGGESTVEALTVKNVKTQEVTTLPVQGVFVAIGQTPNSELVKNIVDTDSNGFIITDENMRTSVEGVFAAGDIRLKALRQVITAASDGAIAAYSAIPYKK